MASPGGFIFVTKGMLRCCKTETALAAVLAHEISHVQHKHGLQAIKESRLTSAMAVLAKEGTETLGGERLNMITDAFEDSVSDVIKTLINNGYSRSCEREADKSAVGILKRVGYNPQGLVDLLEVMDKSLSPTSQGFAKTHPDPCERIQDVQSIISSISEVQPRRYRETRFKKALGHILRT